MNQPTRSGQVRTAGLVRLDSTVTPENLQSRDSSFSDFNNLYQHSYQLAEKNMSLSSPHRLHIIKNRDVVNSSSWNDVHVFENLNKTTTFNESIQYYKSQLGVVDWNSNAYYKDMGAASKKLMDAVLTLVYYTEGHKGLNELYNTIPQPKNDMSFVLADYYPVYNTILYFAPYFLFCSAMEGEMAQILYTPYENICLDFRIYMNDFSATNSELNFISRTQLRLESRLPDIGYVRDLYDLHVQNRLYNLNLLFRFTGNQLTYYGPRVGIPVLMGAISMVLDNSTDQTALALRDNSNQAERESIQAVAELINNIIWPT